MKRAVVIFGICLAAASGHDVITTPITWNHEISRLVFVRCASCHREGGTAFSLMTYEEARPWAVAIKEEVQQRRMPPWGAVKGFGEFRNDQALTPEQIELIVSWASGGVPEGKPEDLPPAPKFEPARAGNPHGGVAMTGDTEIKKAFTLDGLWPQNVPDGATFQITVEYPDGGVEPLLWLYKYKPQFGHAFLLQSPIAIPRGAVIRGVPEGATVLLLPARGPSQARQTERY
ncbi:MAG TPA: hypothetical protein VGF59_19720 [Bryobacteraceae bacterium]|jgi:hypothetical protein